MSEMSQADATDLASLGTSGGPEVTVGTDAAYAAPAGHGLGRPLRNISEVRHFFRTNDVPIYFVGATPFNLLGAGPLGPELLLRHLLRRLGRRAPAGVHPEAQAVHRVRAAARRSTTGCWRTPRCGRSYARPAPRGQRPKVAMVFFDEETERICDELGYDLILPPAELREHLDSKLVTTRLGNEVGAASVPNVLTKVEESDGSSAAATGAGLGADLVVQTAYGDSGKTTFFIGAEADWKRHAATSSARRSR